MVLLERRTPGFVLSMLKVFAVAWHSICDPTASTGNAAAVMLAIVLRAHRHSPFFLDAVRTLLWCDRGSGTCLDHDSKSINRNISIFTCFIIDYFI